MLVHSASPMLTKATFDLIKCYTSKCSCYKVIDAVTKINNDVTVTAC